MYTFNNYTAGIPQMSKIVKTIRCLECGGLLPLDEHHLAQKRHLECSFRKDKKGNKEYYQSYVKKN